MGLTEEVSLEGGGDHVGVEKKKGVNVVAISGDFG